MAGEQYKYCDMYVEAREPEEVEAELEAHFAIRKDGMWLRLPAATLSVGYGPEWPGLPDHFYGWRGEINVSAEPGATDAEVVALVVELMELMRAHGHRVVAECDFAGELPQQDLDGILARGWPQSVEEPRALTQKRWETWQRSRRRR